jgi:hypothetical protein
LSFLFAASAHPGVVDSGELFVVRKPLEDGQKQNFFKIAKQHEKWQNARYHEIFRCNYEHEPCTTRNIAALKNINFEIIK